MRYTRCPGSPPSLRVPLFVFATCAINLLGFAAEPFAADRFDLICDCSKSMTGERLRQAKEGLKLAVFLLPQDSEVVVTSFASSARSSQQMPVKTSLQRQAVFDQINRLTADGGTNYLEPLKLIPATSKAAIFISDGEHNGDVNPVLERCRDATHGPIHTIAVGAKATGTLSRIATLTGGSFTQVTDAEQLVTELLRLSRQINRWHTFSPRQLPVKLTNVRGRLIAIGFDGKPQLVSTSQDRLSHHHADLPRESVDVAVSNSQSPRTVDVSLIGPRSTTARLGAIFRNDLPNSELRVSSVDGSIAAGSRLPVGIVVTDANGKAMREIPPSVATDVSLLDANGRVLKTERAAQSENGFGVVLDVPGEPQVVSVQAKTSVTTPSGQVFVQENAQQLQVVRPTALSFSPGRLVGEFKRGRLTTRKFAVSVTDRAGTPSSVSVNLKQPIAGFELVETEFDQGNLSVHFRATSVGKLRGTLQVTTSSDFVALGELPIDLDIVPAFLGPNWKPEFEIDLGRVLAGTPTLTHQLPIPSKDDEPAQYEVSLSDLAGPNTALETALKANSVTIGGAPKASLSLSADVGNVPAGVYSAKLELKSINAQITRAVAVKLTVTEPITAKPLKLGKVAVGQIVNGRVLVSNIGTRELTKVRLESPSQLFDLKGEPNKAVTFTSVEVARLVPKREVAVAMKVAVSPFTEHRGKLIGQIVLHRGNVDAVKVPVEIEIVERDQRAQFTVAPTELKLRGKSGSLISFKLVIKASIGLEAVEEIAAKPLVFRTEKGDVVRVVNELKWPTGQRLRPNTSIRLHGFIAVPDSKQPLRAAIQVTAPKAGAVTIPLSLDIR